MLGIAAVVSLGAAQAEELPFNLSVTQATIGETICTYGWTKLVRPPYSVTNKIKSQLLREAGLTDADKSRFELDHIIPLSLGGAPSDPRNLQLQPLVEATEKDRVEACLPRLVCEGRLRPRGSAARDLDELEECRETMRLVTSGG